MKRETIFKLILRETIERYMAFHNMESIKEFNEKNDFSLLKIAILPYLVASAAPDRAQSFQSMEPWIMDQLIRKPWGKLCDWGYLIFPEGFTDILPQTAVSEPTLIEEPYWDIDLTNHRLQRVQFHHKIPQLDPEENSLFVSDQMWEELMSIQEKEEFIIKESFKHLIDLRGQTILAFGWDILISLARKNAVWQVALIEHEIEQDKEVDRIFPRKEIESEGFVLTSHVFAAQAKDKIVV